MVRFVAKLEQLIAEVGQAAGSYEPSVAVTDRLRGTALVAIIGPLVVGKTTIMQIAPQINRDFHPIRSFTTRGQQANERPDAYDFLPDSEATCEWLLQRMSEGGLVSIAVHPASGRFYGTTIEEYGSPFSLVDPVPAAYVRMSRLPFGRVVGIALSASAQEWLPRLGRRGGVMSRDAIERRLAEGASTVQWCLDQGEAITWVNNSGREPSETAEEVISIVKQGPILEASVRAREVGYELLGALRAL